MSLHVRCHVFGVISHWLAQTNIFICHNAILQHFVNADALNNQLFGNCGYLAQYSYWNIVFISIKYLKCVVEESPHYKMSQSKKRKDERNAGS